MPFGSYFSFAVTNDPQLERLCEQGELALQPANLKPLDPIVLHATNWQGAFEALCTLIAVGKIDMTAVDDALSPYIMKIEGTIRNFRCRVPLRDYNGNPIYCTHQVQRKDRILRHVKDIHLHYRPYVCGGKCRVPGCDYAAADLRYLEIHIEPRMAVCERCDKSLHRQNLKDHKEKCTGWL